MSKLDKIDKFISDNMPCILLFLAVLGVLFVLFSYNIERNTYPKNTINYNQPTIKIENN